MKLRATARGEPLVPKVHPRFGNAGTTLNFSATQLVLTELRDSNLLAFASNQPAIRGPLGGGDDRIRIGRAA